MPYRRINIPQQALDEIAENPLWSIQSFVATAIQNELKEQKGIKRFLASRKEEKLKLKDNADSK